MLCSDTGNSTEAPRIYECKLLCIFYFEGLQECIGAATFNFSALVAFSSALVGGELCQ
jgi:hypothetical protein